MQIVEEFRIRAGLTRRELALLAEVSPSTVGRIESGEINPTVFMLERLLAAAGAHGTFIVEQASDPYALAAVRAVLDPGSGLQDEPRVQEWLGRFERLGWVCGGDTAVAPSELASRAARFAKLAKRPGMVYLARDKRSWCDYAVGLADSGIDWAATGTMAANQLGAHGDSIWPLFYVADLAQAREVLGLDSFVGPGRQVALLPFDGVSEKAAYTDEDGLSWAAPHAGTHGLLRRHQPDA